MKIKISSLLFLFLLLTSSIAICQTFGASSPQKIDPQEFLRQQLAKPEIEFTQVEKQNIADTSGYTIKSGKIVYEFINGPFSGTLELIFDDYGKKQSEYQVKQFKNSITEQLPASMKGKLKNTEKSLVIKRNDTVYTYNYKANEPKIAIDTTNQNEKNKITQALLQRNVQPIKQEIVLGKEATVVNYFGDYVIWFWKGLILKQEKIVGQNAKITERKIAVSIDENYKPKPSDFKMR